MRGITATAIQGQLDLAVPDLDKQSALSFDALTEDDPHGCRYDVADGMIRVTRPCARQAVMDFGR